MQRGGSVPLRESLHLAVLFHTTRWGVCSFDFDVSSVLLILFSYMTAKTRVLPFSEVLAPSNHHHEVGTEVERLSEKGVPICEMG